MASCGGKRNGFLFRLREVGSFNRNVIIVERVFRIRKFVFDRITGYSGLYVEQTVFMRLRRINPEID
jgi:hypothetical protein